MPVKPLAGKLDGVAPPSSFLKLCRTRAKMERPRSFIPNLDLEMIISVDKQYIFGVVYIMKTYHYVLTCSEG